MTRNISLLLIMLGAIVSSNSSDALTVSPLRVELAPSDGMDTINIENTRSVPVSFSLGAFSWDEADNVDIMQPTDDLLVVPPIFEIGPNEKQVIRVAVRKPLDADREHTYRLVINEVVTEVGRVQGVNFNFKVNMPIFVAPSDAKAKPTWTLEVGAEGSAELVLVNSGNAHVHVKDLTLLKDTHVSPVFALESGSYIFAGERRSWPLDLEAKERNAPLTLQAETDSGPIKMQLSFPEG